MKKATTESLRTNVKGYFNPNTWPVQIAISELNLSIRLEPMQFILDRRTGKKINDPLLDAYVGPKMLRPEIVDTPIEVVPMPVIAAPVQARPGYVVGQGVRDGDGKWQPPTVAAQPEMPLTAPSGATLVSVRESVHGMTVEEARQRGLIGKPKFVPEDYGAAESDGAPVEGRNIPSIKYSIESKPRAAAAQIGALPEALLQNVDPKMAPILEGMKTAASTEQEAALEPVKMTPKVPNTEIQRRTVAVPPAPAQSPAPSVAPAKRRLAQVVVPEHAAEPEPEPEPAARIATTGPVPPSPDSPIYGGRFDDMPEPSLMEGREEPGRELETICAACGKRFKFRSWYVRHVKQAHRDRLSELLPHEAP